MLESRFKQGPVVLVSAPIEYTFPLSYAYLSSYLIEKGENVKMLFKNLDPRELAKQIMELNPVLVGFGSLYPELKDIKEVIRLLSNRRFPIVLGGQMVTPIPEFALEITGADLGVLGEGEIILYELVRAFRSNSDITKVKGLVIKQRDSFINTSPGDYIEDLSLLPPIHYELFPSEKWLNIGDWYAKNYPEQRLFWKAGDKVINVHGGRGCPFNCNFCYHHSKPRYRPIDIMLEEAKIALEKFNGNMLYFSDDLVMASPHRIKELVEGLKKFGSQIEYSISARFDILNRIDDSLLMEIKQTGCRIMSMGIESGSDRILKIIGKNCTSEEIKQGIEKLTKVKILPTVSIQIGQYTETLEDVEMSIQLVKDTIKINPNIQYAFTITTPFPGSPLYNTLLNEGKITHQSFYDKYFSSQIGGCWSQVFNFSAMRDSDILRMWQEIWDVYREEKAKRIN